ncbi:leucine-rich repeat and guanylate kinase domain-containing protein [Osmerus eperlanus]|uniref:leucine-rich repeat and guanylate kinase domain-containing protein n=1 Tax=Osmerus eperlanus TaxID=29151 RepID=UPI002E132A71
MGDEQQVPQTPAVPQTCADRLSTSNEEQIEKMKKDGVLTEEQVASCLSNLGHSATGLQHVYQFLSIPGRHLSNISILSNYVYLQKLEIPHNNIKDLSCVSHMPYLIILDASHNEISDFFGFQPPKNLKEVNLSHNRMVLMKDLSAYCSLSKLKLDYNSFSQIRGLGRCTGLTHLSLAHNKLSHISGLNNLPLKELCLRGNQITKIENMETLRSLHVVDLSFNKIQSLSGLQDLILLGSVNLERNLISDIKEASHLHSLYLLRELNLLKNPVQDQPDCRLALIFLLQHLSGLDQQKVTAEEKVSSVNRYDPPLEVVAARDHMTHMVYQLMQPQVLYDSTLPSLDSPYPMLVLTGPQACGKRELAHKLCLDFTDFFSYGACHTTRDPYFGEENGSDYHFVTEEVFQNMIHMGQFIQTMQYGGHWYGLSREAVEAVAREGLACCVHMELEGVFSLKNSYFEPRYVLLIPTDQERYCLRLRRRALYTQPQVEAALGRVHLYARVSREHPGFFDDVIRCDDPAEAYTSLKQVVRQYLGLHQAGGDHKQSSSSTPDTSTELSREEVPAKERSRPPSSPAEAGLPSSPGPAPEPSEAGVCRTYLSKVQAQLTPLKTPAELSSLQRRQQLVREALKGRSPEAYTQLFKRSAQTAPSLLTSQSQDPARSPSRIPPQNQPEDSSDESRASSALSIPSSTGASSKTAGPAGGSELGSEPHVEPLDTTSLEHTLETLQDQVETSHTPDAPRPASGLLSPAVTPSSGRPGSNARPVLPPIPPGRKSPSPSPTTLPDLGPRP